MVVFPYSDSVPLRTSVDTNWRNLCAVRGYLHTVDNLSLIHIYDTQVADGTIRYHKVKSGDTLSRIAKLRGVSVSTLCKLKDVYKRQVQYPYDLTVRYRFIRREGAGNVRGIVCG